MLHFIETKNRCIMIDRIKELTGIDITDKTRKRNVVELKALYCYLMKQKGNTYTSIGKQIGLNHATIIHHYKEYPYIRKNREDLKELEELLKKMSEYEETKEPTSIELEILKKQNKEYKERLEAIEKEFSENKLQIIKRLIPLLSTKHIYDKLEAFIIINEKAKYYPKYN